MSSVDDKRIVLGPEHDQSLQEALRDVLRGLGATSIRHDWGVAGSQQLEELAVDIGAQRVLVEAETYIGLSITGPPELVDGIAKLLNERR
jgi:hypothetical protein